MVNLRHIRETSKDPNLLEIWKISEISEGNQLKSLLGNLPRKFSFFKGFSRSANIRIGHIQSGVLHEMVPVEVKFWERNYSTR